MISFVELLHRHLYVIFFIIILSYLCFLYAIFSAAALELLCDVFDFRVRTSHKCIFVFVCLFTIFLFLSKTFFLEKNTYFSGLSWENQPQTPPMFWLGVSELGRGVLTR